MANAKSTESAEQVQFRGRGRDDEYRVLSGEKEIGKVVRKRDAKKQPLGWVPKGAPKGFKPTSRKLAAEALVSS